MAVLRASNLAKSYKQKKVVIDVSLEIRSGEIVGLLGPNGAGKTTCFYMIVGLVPSDNGRITIDNQDITPLPMHGRARKGIGYLPQEASVFRKLTVRDNILAILETRRELKRTDREAKLEDCLKSFTSPTSAIASAWPCQVASDDGWKLPAHWRWSRHSSCWTSPSLGSIPSQ